MADRVVYTRTKGIKHFVTTAEASAGIVKIEIVPDQDDTDVIDDMIFTFTIKSPAGTPLDYIADMYAVFHYDDSKSTFVTGDVGNVVFTEQGGSFAFVVGVEIDVMIMRDGE